MTQMKLHALALCLFGVVACAGPAMANDRHHDRDRVSDTYAVEERMYFIGNLYPDLPPLDEVASKVSEIVTSQEQEVAELTAYRPVAQTAGYENIVTVYDAMITDHDRLVDYGSQWLVRYGYTVPARPTVTVAVSTAPTESLDHVIAMHQDVFNSCLEKRHSERSSTVRGMLLWEAATANRHIAWLRVVDHEIDLGRKTVSGRLRAAMNTDLTTDRLVAEITTEDQAIFGVIQQPQVIEQVVEVPVPVEKIVTVERIVEKPVDRIVERVVEKPVYVDRIVEKPVYIKNKVAGRRSTYRRPAK
jgi:hypothetical protein